MSCEHKSSFKQTKNKVTCFYLSYTQLENVFFKNILLFSNYLHFQFTVKVQIATSHINQNETLFAKRKANKISFQEW